MLRKCASASDSVSSIGQGLNIFLQTYHFNACYVQCFLVISAVNAPCIAFPILVSSSFTLQFFFFFFTQSAYNYYCYSHFFLYFTSKLMRKYLKLCLQNIQRLNISDMEHLCSTGLGDL